MGWCGCRLADGLVRVPPCGWAGAGAALRMGWCGCRLADGLVRVPPCGWAGAGGALRMGWCGAVGRWRDVDASLVSLGT